MILDPACRHCSQITNTFQEAKRFTNQAEALNVICTSVKGGRNLLTCYCLDCKILYFSVTYIVVKLWNPRTSRSELSDLIGGGGGGIWKEI